MEKTLYVRIDLELYNMLLDRSKKEGRSLSGMAREMLYKGLSCPVFNVYKHDKFRGLVEYSIKLEGDSE